MSFSRFSAVDNVYNRTYPGWKTESSDQQPISKYFGSHVFHDEAMRQYLPEDAYLQLKKVIQSGEKMSETVANVVADAMKKWAIERGATHFAHWFQPLTGRTAEKHDSFFTLNSQGFAIEEFRGKELAQQEPDGSSFPGGGLRSTFEARGYTAWDPSSPAFILEVGSGKTLCIPTIFITYGGEALDYKLPLLKSQDFLSKAALPVAQWFDPEATGVYTTLGWEQEYFLVDEALYNARPDLVMCGRTLIGMHSPKGQQLEDHYFGSIPERVYAFMVDLEKECHQLGIPVRTRHNEVGPGQYELAPMFEEVNVAVDHNSLLMDLMDRVARRHKLRVLLHEKPFAGVNGSGKHNNWSLATNTGKNLLSPGQNPGTNLRFLTFFVNTIRAVAEHADLLRASIASASNDHRLGANEAPPAIVSVFVGEQLTNVLDQIESGETRDEDVKKILNLLSRLPNLELDNTDRNRTSPFAFTGNKFEIRMVGSNQNCAAPMSTLNTMMGQQLITFRKEVENLMSQGMDRDAAILTLLKQYIHETKQIRFEGDNYSEEWHQEAERRGLNNFKTTPEALDAYMSEKSAALFLQAGVFSKKELHAHHDVMLDSYSLKIDLESLTLEELASNFVLPSAIEYQSVLAGNIQQMQSIGLGGKEVETQMKIVKEISNHIQQLGSQLDKMRKDREIANGLAGSRQKAIFMCDHVKVSMDEIRIHCDCLESLVDDKLWNLPKYRELMFMK